jgi:putative SOS response-associated peptidase YedK
MCGRYTRYGNVKVYEDDFEYQAALKKYLAESLRQFQEAYRKAQYNIVPTQDVLIVRQNGGEREPAFVRWGLIPVWAKSPQGGPPLINARAETVADKPTFRHALRRRRCIVPADGFYEWKQTSGVTTRGKKQPYYIHRNDNRPLAFAGLWDSWIEKLPTSSKREPLRIESCTIVTTTANATLAPLHDRMPVILSRNDYSLWLDSDVREPEAVAHLMVPYEGDELIAVPVSTAVNKVGNDGPELIEPLKQGELF